ncbi:MAG: hypothetical protein GY851_02885 [bacterium]|nr:hypothetical protein [bacterium]
MMKCHSCGREWTTEKRVKVPGVKESCEQCNAYLHCCLNCKFHDTGKHNECTVPNSDWVGDRTGANFCDHFAFRAFGDGDSTGQPDAGRSALDKLFGDSDTPNDEERLDAFNNLFDE